MRASDTDRERVAYTLRDQAGEGRLDPDELEQRLEATYTAKTLGDLDALVADLPAEPQPQPRSRGWQWQPLVLLVAALVAVSVIVGHAIFWIAFPLFFWVWRPLFRPRWRRVY
jgi:hypothetical protein